MGHKRWIMGYGLGWQAGTAGLGVRNSVRRRGEHHRAKDAKNTEGNMGVQTVWPQASVLA
ncbi:MAG: hypothetical protein U9Q94_05230 [Candidatus Bipolaricaulota bacterium]|nr:hypothetical protein [Candidatus Bipolaricaulota bacterium]